MCCLCFQIRLVWLWFQPSTPPREKASLPEGGAVESVSWYVPCYTQLAFSPSQTLPRMRESYQQGEQVTWDSHRLAPLWAWRQRSASLDKAGFVAWFLPRLVNLKRPLQGKWCCLTCMFAGGICGAFQSSAWFISEEMRLPPVRGVILGLGLCPQQLQTGALCFLWAVGEEAEGWSLALVPFSWWEMGHLGFFWGCIRHAEKLLGWESQ